VNFGTILNAMTKHCVKLVMEGAESNSKTLAKDFTRYIQIKDVLNTQFKVYHSLNTSYVKNSEDARLFVSETINTLKPYSFSDIKGYNALLETRFHPPKMKSTELNTHIGNLIRFATSDSSNVSSYVESLAFVTEHVKEIKEPVNQLREVDNKLANSSLKFLEPKHVVRIAVKSFNNEFKTMSEGDRNIFNILRSKNEKEIQTLFESQLAELDNLLDNMTFMDHIGEDLSNKINESMKILRNECSQKNILNGYELLDELKELNK